VLAGFVPEGEFDPIPQSELVINDAQIVLHAMLGGSEGICNFAVFESLSDKFDDKLLPFASYTVSVTLVSDSCLRFNRVASLCCLLSSVAGKEAPSPGMGSEDLGNGDRAFPSRQDRHILYLMRLCKTHVRCNSLLPPLRARSRGEVRKKDAERADKRGICEPA
jgi:hypothetical protein